VEDMIHLPEGLEDFGPEQPVGVRDDAESHAG
jgi:hypothetical protein